MTKTARYLSFTETAMLRVEVSFLGSDEIGRSNPANTDVIVRCFRRHNEHNRLAPWVQIWVNNYGDLEMPEGAWHGVELSTISEQRIFLALSNELCEVDVDSGETYWTTSTGNTPIRQIIQSQKGNCIIVRNSHYQFVDNSGGGCIAAISFDGDSMWRAESPGAGDDFANPVAYDQGVLKSASFCGWECSIDDRNGKIVDRVFTK